MNDFWQLVVSGLANGSVYMLVALGFSLIYKASGVLNFAQGELMMVGAYVCFWLISSLNLGFWPALVLTMVFSLTFGYALETVFLRRMIGESTFSVIMITLGFASLFRSLVGVVFGTVEKGFPTPLDGLDYRIGGVILWQTQVWAIIVAFGIFAGFLVFFRYAKIGLAMRAAAEDQDVARLMGININQIFALSWAIAAMVGSIAGIFSADLSFLYSQMSLAGLKALPAAILAGLDSVEGVLLGGLVIGLVESLAGGYFGGPAHELAPWLVLLLVLMVKPRGLFGSSEIKRV